MKHFNVKKNNIKVPPIIYIMDDKGIRKNPNIPRKLFTDIKPINSVQFVFDGRS